MPRFLPPKYIRALTQFQGRALADIPQEKIEEVKGKLAKFRKVENPQVSIVFIAYNEEDYIFLAMASMADMELPWPAELLVVNNNSNDNTQAILDALQVKTVLETTQGYGAARNAGLSAARANILLTADADNMYPKTWAKTMATPLLRNEDIVVTCSLYCFYTNNDRYSIGLELYQQARLVNNLMRHSKRPHLNCLGGSMGLRKEQALAAGGYQNKGRGEDGGLAFLLQEKGKIKLITSKRAFSFSNLRTVFQDGSLGKAFKVRIKKYSKRMLGYFVKQKA